MLIFVLRRLLLAIPVLLGVVFAVMLIMELIPGDPVALMRGDAATPEATARLGEYLGLERPFVVRYTPAHAHAGSPRGGPGHVAGPGDRPERRGAALRRATRGDPSDLVGAEAGGQVEARFVVLQSRSTLGVMVTLS